MSMVLLKPFVRPGLDVLFLALNPPLQSNTNGHYFSGGQSRFYDLLFKSGLVIQAVSRSRADEIVFGPAGITYLVARTSLGLKRSSETRVTG